MLRDREHSRRRASVIEFPAVFKSIVFAGEQRSRPERRDDVASLSARTKESSTEDWIRNRYVEKTSKRVARSTPSPNSRLPESFSINPGEPTSLQEREREREIGHLLNPVRQTGHLHVEMKKNIKILTAGHIPVVKRKRSICLVISDISRFRLGNVTRECRVNVDISEYF